MQLDILQQLLVLVNWPVLYGVRPLVCLGLHRRLLVLDCNRPDAHSGALNIVLKLKANLYKTRRNDEIPSLPYY